MLNQSKCHFIFSIIIVNLIIAPLAHSEPSSKPTMKEGLFEENKTISKLAYQSASKFTHLQWFKEQNSLNTITLLPIINFSGIPIEELLEKSNYFTHDKKPSVINRLFEDLIYSSHYFEDNRVVKNTHKIAKSDYQFQLQINQYQPPIKDTSDDSWWNKKNNADRSLQSSVEAKISLTLKIKGYKKQLTPWSRTIETQLSICDVNRFSQPMSEYSHRNNRISKYSSSTMGQVFISASNFLILQAIHHLNKYNTLAHVASKFDNEILIVSEQHQFSIGQELYLYYNNEYSSQSVLPAGKVQIIKTYQNQAVAYPVDLNFNKIKEGDWIEVSQVKKFITPQSNFTHKKVCEKNRVNNAYSSVSLN
jgi:hypothetical protein